MGAVPITRRRALKVLAAAGGLALAPRAVGGGTAREPAPLRWRGGALGTEAEIVLYHADRARAEVAIARALDEVERLENEFSLYRGDSALARLNREGRLVRPSLDMVAVMVEARRLSALSAGAFDVTVQPLWRLHADHYADGGADPRGPDRRAIAAARARVDWRALEVDRNLAVFARPGMSATLNGIAQGYITDRVADLLRQEGFDHVLVDLGEIRALGGRGGRRRPWRLGLAHGADAHRPSSILAIVDRAVATSAGAGTTFGPGRDHHLFDPLSGRSARQYRAVTVVARRAVVADGLATALYVAVPDEAPGLLAAGGGESAFLTFADGNTTRLGT